MARSASRIIAGEAERRFSEYFEQHPVAMFIFDVHSFAILTANAAAQCQYGATLGELRAMPVDRLRPPEDAVTFRNDLKRYIESGNLGGSAGVRRHVRADGTLIHVEIAYHLLEYAGHEACFTTAHDVSAHERAKENLRLRSRALEASGSAVVISHEVDGENVITYANASVERITGCPTEDMIGVEQWKALGCDRSSAELVPVRSAMRAAREGSALLKSLRRDGSVYWSQLQVSPVLDEHNSVTHFITVFSDASECIQYQERLHRQAHEDPLTHLANRLGLTARLHEMLANAAAAGDRLAIVFLDLDSFKEINDSLGHAAGDAVLSEVARRLSAHVSAHELVARYAGDEFVALLYGRGAVERFVAAAKAMKDSLMDEIETASGTVSPQASAGLAIFPDHSTDADTLLAYADSAMYRAKSLGPGSMQVFDPSIATENSERVLLIHRLRRAVASGGFSLAYQPRVSLASGKANGFEALLRWNDPELGSVSPALFVPIAEGSGLIVQIGEWVFEQVCLQTKEWTLHYPDIIVSVNVSPVQFVRTDLPAIVAATLARTGVSPRNIELEITEGVLMTPGALDALSSFRKMGLSIAIDDFGSGYSSLGYLRSFTADRLKLDMSFVQGIGHSRADEVIVKAVLAMGRTLGMRVVAEGVETALQLDFLIGNGCDESQGYWFAPPSDPATARAYLDSPCGAESTLPAED